LFCSNKNIACTSQRYVSLLSFPRCVERSNFNVHMHRKIRMQWVCRILVFTELFLLANSMSSASSEIIRLRNFGMQQRDLESHKGLRRASVLVPLFRKDDDKLHVLLTQRPLHMKAHPGEVCFPGGKQDPEDEADDVETALREAWEEVGLERASIESICRLATVESKGGLCVTPIVALLEPPDSKQLKVCKDEVEAVLTVPIEFFLERSGNLADKCDVPWSRGMFTVRTYFYQDEEDKEFKISGLTAYVLHQVACLAIDGSLDEEEPAARLAVGKISAL
jgi:coenzyme A diphosphatase NUDT7